MEQQKRLLTDLLIPEAKKRKVDLKVIKTEKYSKTEKPIVIELGILPPLEQLQQSTFELKEENDTMNISGNYHEKIFYQKVQNAEHEMNYAIGIRNKKTNEIEIIPVNYFQLQSSIESKISNESDEQNSYYANKLALNTSFGTTKTRINKIISHKMEEIHGTYDIQREEQEIENENEKETRNKENNQLSFPDLPKFNATTKEQSEIYSIDSLMNFDEKDYVSQCARVLYEKRSEKDQMEYLQLKQIIFSTKFSEEFKRTIDSLEKKQFLNIISLLEFYRILSVINSSGSHMRTKERISSIANQYNIDENVLFSMIDRLFDRDLNKRQEQFVFSPLNKTFIVHLAMIIALHITKFAVSDDVLKFIGVDFKLDDRECSKHMQRIGCTSEKRFNPVNGKRQFVYSLHAPLKLRDDLGSKKGKK